DGIRDRNVTGVQTCALPISCSKGIGATSERSRINSSQYFFGRISECMEAICPSLIYVGPSSSRIRRSFSGVTPREIACLWSTEVISFKRFPYFSDDCSLIKTILSLLYPLLMSLPVLLLFPPDLSRIPPVPSALLPSSRSPLLNQQAVPASSFLPVPEVPPETTV